MDKENNRILHIAKSISFVLGNMYLTFIADFVPTIEATAVTLNCAIGVIHDDMLRD